MCALGLRELDIHDVFANPLRRYVIVSLLHLVLRESVTRACGRDGAIMTHRSASCQHLARHSSASATRQKIHKMTLFIKQHALDDESNNHFQCIHRMAHNERFCCVAIIITEPDCYESDS